jgi:predicted RNase H-like nuclease (RuvC/YqgF family)
VVGATDRERIEAEIDDLASRQEELEDRIKALDSREDEVYRRWRDDYHKRRYQVPKVTRLFRAAFRIDPPEPTTSC